MNPEPQKAQPTPPAGSRDKILRRIKEALQFQAPKRFLDSHNSSNFHPQGNSKSKETKQIEESIPSNESANLQGNFQSAIAQHRKWLPQVPRDLPGRIQLFASLSETLRTNFIHCKDFSEVLSHLQQLSVAESWKTLFVQSTEWKSAIESSLPSVTIHTTHSSYDKNALAAADGGITGCECLVAQTGSVLISSTYCGGRNLSVLPPHHIVIADSTQLVGDLIDAFALLREKYGSQFPPYLSFITGPSRTGDIERILVLGAHGPKKLTIFLLDKPIFGREKVPS